MAKKQGCFECGEEGHWRSRCPWLDKDCVKACGRKMRLLISGREASKGCRFMKCICGAFFWIDTPHASSSSVISGGTLKVTLPGEYNMVVEGSVDDIAELMRKLKS